MSETETSQIWDRELNEAIVTLAKIHLPRGYGTVSNEEFAGPGFQLWDAFDRDGRPTVNQMTRTTSIFGDVEIEIAFNALMAQMTLGSELAKEHAAHKPDICPVMTIAGLDGIAKAIVDRYGDDERTQRWRKGIYAHFLGLAVLAIDGQPMPSNAKEFVEKGLPIADPDSKLSVAEFRDGMVGLFSEAIVGRMLGGLARRGLEDGATHPNPGTIN
jgi:hypothetical protein